MNEFWLMNNRNVAENNTLHMLIGMLGFRKDEGLPVTAEEILQYIEEKVDEEERRLNESFPSKARVSVVE